MTASPGARAIACAEPHLERSPIRPLACEASGPGSMLRGTRLGPERRTSDTRAARQIRAKGALATTAPSAQPPAILSDSSAQRAAEGCDEIAHTHHVVWDFKSSMESHTRGQPARTMSNAPGWREVGSTELQGFCWQRLFPRLPENRGVPGSSPGLAIGLGPPAPQSSRHRTPRCQVRGAGSTRTRKRPKREDQCRVAWN